MSRAVGKKSERSKAQAKALEESRVDPAVTRLQATLEENLDFFLNNIGTMIKDLNAKLAATNAAAEKAHKEMGVSLATALVERTREGSPTPAGSPAAPKPATASGDGAAATTLDTDTEAAAAAAAIAAKVREADERRAQKQQLQREATAKAEAEAGQAQTSSSTEAEKKDAANADTKKADAEGGKKAAKKTIPIVYPGNSLLLDELKGLKKDAYALGTTFDGIHDWVALNIPDFKEEDNMGVEIMGAVIQQISNLQETVRDVYALELKYLEERSELEKALLKVPDSETIVRQLEVLDLDTWDEVERGWRSMIRVGLILFSMLSKNMKALREPRKSARSTLFM